MPTFIYVMDPMCSWCWAFQPAISALKERYPSHLWQYIMGGLAPDSDTPMPPEMQNKIATIWKQIERDTNTRFNHNFWAENSPRRSTYPACRAVITAEIMTTGAGYEMIEAIQQAYYLNALNPSNQSTLIKLAHKLNLNIEKFQTLLTSPSIQHELEQHLIHSRQLGAQGFPSLFLQEKNEIRTVSLGYCDARELLRRVGERGKE